MCRDGLAHNVRIRHLSSDFVAPELLPGHARGLDFDSEPHWEVLARRKTKLHVLESSEAALEKIIAEDARLYHVSKFLISYPGYILVSS